MFYTHYPYITQEKETLVMKNRVPYSHDSKLLFQSCQKYVNPDGMKDEIIFRKSFSEVETSINSICGEELYR